MLRLFAILVLTLAALPTHAQEPQWLAPRAEPLALGEALPPCPIFRKVFTIPVFNFSTLSQQARVRVVGLGHYELRLNGRLVGDSLINQPWSQYDRTIFVQEFDITSLLRPGENVFAVSLGNSFWRVGPANDPQRFVKTDAMPDFSEGFPFLLWLEARIPSADGKETVIVSDDSWRWTDGPITFSHIYAGEDFDARLVPPGWDLPAASAGPFDDSLWNAPAVVAAPRAQLAPFTAPPIRSFEVFQPVSVRQPEPGVYTYVFPQNCSSVLRFTVSGTPGARIRFKPCEYIDERGKVKFTYTWGTKKDIWHDYTLRGDHEHAYSNVRERETHQTVFCYVGAQFVEVTGAVPAGEPNPGKLPVLHSLELVHTRTACPPVGSFICSSNIYTKAHSIIDWTIRSNMSHVSTDCPHREKNGWQEQNWHMARSLSYRYDTNAWMSKICRDIRDTQLADGHIPTNCPLYLVGIPPHGYWNEAPEWGISGVLVPWHLYEWYGDTQILEASFDSMKRYVAYLGTLAEDGVIKSNLGDWYDYGHGKGDGNSQWTPSEVSATAVWAHGASTVARVATILGEPDQSRTYQALFEQIRADFQRRFYDPATATVRNNGSCQAGTAAALCIGLIPEADRARAVQAIVDDLESRRYQQTAGEVLHVFLMRALAENGRNDILHKVYSRDDRGSYGFMVKSGLTTLPESWSATPGTGNSMNHFMLGHLVEWHFAFVAGIRQEPGSFGWRRVVIAPSPGHLRSFDTSFESPAGPIRVKCTSWLSSPDSRIFDVEIPPGVASAVFQYPDGRTFELRPGKNAISWPYRPAP